MSGHCARHDRLAGAKSRFPKFHRVAGVLWLASILAAPAAATGLLGEYFDNNDFSGLKVTRVDAAVDFDWGTGPPAAGMGADTYSVRWSGQIEPPFSEPWTFYVLADNGARLWVNDRLVAARTMPPAATKEISGRIPLEAGRRYNITLELIKNSGNGRARLDWASPSQPREIIPQSRLCPALGLADTGCLLVEHWLNLPGTNLDTLVTAPNFPDRPDSRDFVTTFECLQADWADDYGTRVSGYIVPPATGNYVFAVSGSDAVQLFLSPDANAANRQLIASNAVPTGFRDFTASPGQVSAPVPLAALQKYSVELRHKAGTGNDHFSVAWRAADDTNFNVISAAALAPAGLHLAAPVETNFLATLVPAHPRLLLSAERFEWLRRGLASNSVPQLAAWWTTISNSANSILAQPVSVYTPDNRGTILSTSRTVGDRIYKLALAWRLTGNTNFAERAWAELQQVASTNFPDWHPAHFLDTAEMTHACAVGYDWLYDYWTQPRRDTIRAAIIAKGLNQSLVIYSNNSSWAASTANNWNLVCNGGMILGALAVGAENESLSEFILSRAVASAALVMRHYTTDNGGWYEGPGYWDYTTSYNMLLLPALESALGSDFSLSDTRALAETGVFARGMPGPGKLSFNFADAGAGNLRGPQLFWLSRRFNRPEFAWHERVNASPEVLDLLWYDARGTDPATAGLPPDNWFHGPTGVTPYFPADALTLRSRWQDADAAFVGFKAGEIGASHGHLDAGTFVLDALGRRWAHDLGGDDYALPGYFGSQRWTYYRLRAEGHNTLVINPDANPDQNLGAQPPILLYCTEPGAERSAAVADLTGAYDVTRVWRGVALLNGRRCVLVQDEIEAAAPATVWWFMHLNTNTAVQIATNGASAMLTQGGSRLWLKILSGGGAFCLSNAVPLPTSPKPAGQNANTAYRKLAVKLTGVTNTTLAVLLTPLRAGENPSAGGPNLVPLNQWADLGTANPVAAWTNLVTAEDTTADLDLRALAVDAVTPPDQFVFYVEGPANGTVTLMADGHTARFLPATNYTGPAGFSYSVLGNQGGPVTNRVGVTVLPVNDAPTAAPGTNSTFRNASLDFDLWSVAGDLETPASNLLFNVADPRNGVVTLLADGHTARFTPAADFIGSAGFTYTVTDLSEDPRALVHYSFTPPEAVVGAVVPDDTGKGHDGALAALGSGSYSLSDNVPAALAGDVAASLMLNELGSNGAARVQCSIGTNDFNLSDSRWTFAAWVQRFATTNDDFLFYLGGGDGFSGNGDEFQLYCPSGQNAVRARHYNSANALDLDINSGARLDAYHWHHVALAFDRSGPNTGALRLYTDGALAVTSTNITWALQQTTPILLGGHNSGGRLERNWNGRLADVVLFTDSLSASEIARLSARAVARFGGLTATNTATINYVVPPTPPLAGVMISGTNLLIDAVNGPPGASCRVLTSTNAALPRANWTVLATNLFDRAGNCSFTNDLDLAQRCRFFILQVP